MSVVQCKECGHGVSTKAKNCPSCGAPIAKPTSCAVGCLAVAFLAVSVVICMAVINSYNATQTNGSQNKTTYRQSSTAKPDLPQPSTPVHAIPDDVSYTVVVKQIKPGIKRSLEVTLNRRVTEDELRAIALKLKSEDPNPYERTFILYYLKDVKNPVAAWATTHFNPDLEVQIMGLTTEDTKALLKPPVSTDRDTIGRWLDESPYSGGIITIYRDNGKIIFEQKFSDGSVMTKELVERSSSLGRRFNMKETSYAGDHFVIDRNGDLQLRDNEGLITTANKIGP